MKRNLLFALFVSIAGGCYAEEQAGGPIVEAGSPWRNGTAKAIEAGIQRLGSWWCKLIHDAPTWPIHRRYECRTCGRHYPVMW